MVGLSASGVVPVLVGAWLAMQGAVTLWMVRGGAQRACRRNA